MEGFFNKKLFHCGQINSGFLLGFSFRGGRNQNFLGGVPSKFSGANDSDGGQKIFKENEIFTLES